MSPPACKSSSSFAPFLSCCTLCNQMWRSNTAVCHMSVYVSSLVSLVLGSGPCAAVWDCDAWDAASVLSVSWGCFGCAGLGQQDKVDPAHSTVVYSQASVHPGLTVVHCVQTHGTERNSVTVSAVSMFGLWLREVNFPQLLPCFAATVGVSQSVWQMTTYWSQLLCCSELWEGGNSLMIFFVRDCSQFSEVRYACLSVCPLGS